MGVTGHLDDASLGGKRVRQIQAIVAAEGIGMQVSPIVGQEQLWSVTLAVEGEVEEVERMSEIAQVTPQSRGVEEMRGGILLFHRCVVGVQGSGQQDPGEHQLVQWFEQVTTGQQPVAQRGAWQEETLPPIGSL